MKVTLLQPMVAIASLILLAGCLAAPASSKKSRAAAPESSAASSPSKAFVIIPEEPAATDRRSRSIGWDDHHGYKEVKEIVRTVHVPVPVPVEKHIVVEKKVPVLVKPVKKSGKIVVRIKKKKHSHRG
ncbi:uncharacterized protein LOC129740144 [Uranotaenia lowii]|uniref:uncharacterized protein LOC129740144 n=1 Tax=Uranotaenia lowii TaxID=190385 RepID=UPI0024790C6F|nr:uncharacterized protein LOC129740144 [Uranotaenia lowii]